MLFKMIVSTPISRTPKYWRVSNDKMELMYCVETEFINATRLCFSIRKTNCLEKWFRSDNALRIQYHLRKQLEPKSLMEFNVKSATGCEVYIHPALAIHLANWFGPEYNYPMMQLLQEITINIALRNRATLIAQPPKTHSFIFLELSKHKTMHQYFAIECDTADCGGRIDRVVGIWPNAEVIFQQHHVPKHVKVLEELKLNWSGEGDISINVNDYCGSAMEEVALLTLLKKMCQSDEDPAIMRCAYDVPDCASSAYDNIV